VWGRNKGPINFRVGPAAEWPVRDEDGREGGSVCSQDLRPGCRPEAGGKICHGEMTLIPKLPLEAPHGVLLCDVFVPWSLTAQQGIVQRLLKQAFHCLWFMR